MLTGVVQDKDERKERETVEGREGQSGGWEVRRAARGITRGLCNEG